MFSDFVKFLQEEYGDSLTVVSQTDNGSNFVVADDFNLIDMDHVAVDFARNPRKKDSRRKRKSSRRRAGDKGRERPSTVDGLFVSKDLSNFYFIEFKKMKLEDDDLPITYSYLKKTRKETPIKEYGDFLESFKESDYENLNDFKESAEKVNTFLQTYNRCQSHLDDKTKNSLKIKPLSTLVLLKTIYNQFKNYEEYKASGKLNPDVKFKINHVYNENFKEDAETLMIFSNINFFYIIVYEFGFLTPNKSHKKRDLKQYFKFLKNINPYPFDVTIPVNEKKFVKVVLPNIKSN